MSERYNEVETIEVAQKIKVVLYRRPVEGRYLFHLVDGYPCLSLDAEQARKLSEALIQLLAKVETKTKEQEQEDMYFIDNGECHGSQALERLEPPKGQEPKMLHIQINRLDGSCPVQASGTIEDHSAFYFRGRHEQWQFVAGPKELNTNGLVKVQLKLTQDSRVFVLEGDDEERMYLDYDHVRRCLQTYAQQYVEWMNERRDTNEQEDKEEH